MTRARLLLFALPLVAGLSLLTFGCNRTGGNTALADVSNIKEQSTDAQFAYLNGYRFGESAAEDSVFKANLDAFLKAFREGAMLDTTKDMGKIIAAQGLLTGRQFASDTTAVRHLEVFMAAFAAGAKGDSSQYTQAEQQRVVQAYSEQMMLQQLRQQAAIDPQAKAYLDRAEANKAKADSFLTANRSKQGVMQTPSGLQFEVLQQGQGTPPAPGAQVVVNYEGTFLNGQVFDSSIQRGQPATFSLDGVIPGYSEGLQLMSKGSKYRFYIPPGLGYGLGDPSNQVIGPNELLIFEVELLDILPAAAPQGFPLQ